MPTRNREGKRDHLFVRYSGNPILTVANWPYPATRVFNPGAIRLHNGTTLLLCRVENRNGYSHLCAARSADGVTDWQIDEEPTLLPVPVGYPEEQWGIEDPRITYMEQLGFYLVTYTSYSPNGPAVSLARTWDFRHFARYGLITPAQDKDAAIVPRIINGRWLLIHRPVTHIGISYSSDLYSWGQHEVLLRPGPEGWDSLRVGLAGPPIETSRGWLVLYHGVEGSIYRVGLALFDPLFQRLLSRRSTWIFGPETAYEQNIVFPCGHTVNGDTINLYYGAADTSVAMAQGSIQALLAWLDHHSGSKGGGMNETDWVV